MKYLARILLIVILLLIVLAGLVSCIKQKPFRFDHPKNAWITDCIVCPGNPCNANDDASVSALFGYRGESGIASEDTIRWDGHVDSSSSEFYIVYLIYGTECQGESPDTYFELTHVWGETVTHDEDDGLIGIEPIEVYGGIEATLDMTKAPSERLSVTFTKETVYGAIVIPIRLLADEPLGTTIFVDMSIELERETTTVDSHEKYVFLETGASDPLAEIVGLSAGYLTQSEYNNGKYSDSDIKPTTVFRSGESQYAVIDFKLRELEDNTSYESVTAQIYLSDRQAMEMNLQEAPTAKIEKDTVGNSARIQAVYMLPEKKGMEKSIRMILELVPLHEGDLMLDVFIYVTDNETWNLSGKTHLSVPLSH